MKNLFVPYHIAKQLKEKGFNEPCLGTYLTEKSIREGKLYPAEKDVDVTPQYDEDGYENFVIIKNSDCDGVPQYMSAPMYQQILDWFEEKHRLYIETPMYVVDSGEYDGCYAFKSVIKDTENYKEKIVFEEKEFPKRYKALNKAIEEALKLI